MKASEVSKKLIICSPSFIPFAGLPLFGTGGIHFTVSRAYLSIVLVAFFARTVTRGGLVLPSGRSGTIFWGLILYGFLLTVSVFWSDNELRAVSYTLYYFWYVLFIGVFLTAGLDCKDINKFYDTWIITGALVAFMCFIEVAFEIRFPGSRYISEDSLYQFRPTVTMHNENNLAIYLAITSFFALARSQTVGLLVRWCIWLAIVWVFYVILLTGSRGGFVVFLIGLSLFSLLNNKVSFFSLIKVTAIFFMTLVLSIYVGFFDDVIATFNQVSAVFDEGDGRIPLLENALLAMQENHGFGVGAGGIEEYMSQFSNVRVENVHNWFGEIVANTDVMGGAIWGVILFLTFYWSFGLRRQSGKYWASAFVGLMLFPLWQSIVSSMINFAAFWLFLAALLVQLDLKVRTASE